MSLRIKRYPFYIGITTLIVTIVIILTGLFLMISHRESKVASIQLADRLFTEINANPIPEGGCLNDTILFDTGLSPERFTFDWDLGDGNTSTEGAFEHFYPALGTYPVSLILHDQCLNETDTFFLASKYL